MRGNWIGCAAGAVICLIVAWLLAPLIPQPTVANIISIIAWIGFVVLALLAILFLVTGRGGRTPV